MTLAEQNLTTALQLKMITPAEFLRRWKALHAPKPIFSVCPKAGIA